MIQLNVRKVNPDDAHFINEYWRDQTEDDLVRMGELERPDARENINFVNWFCSSPFDPKTAIEDIRVWCMDGSPVGYSTLKEIRYGADAQIHLHLGKHYLRKGMGAALFCLSAQEFYDVYELRDLYCQPRSENPMPNGMLRKAGFEFVGEVDIDRRDGSNIMQNRYRIDRKTLENFLSAVRGRFSI